MNEIETGTQCQLSVKHNRWTQIDTVDDKLERIRNRSDTRVFIWIKRTDDLEALNKNDNIVLTLLKESAKDGRRGEEARRVNEKILMMNKNFYETDNMDLVRGRKWVNVRSGFSNEKDEVLMMDKEVKKNEC